MKKNLPSKIDNYLIIKCLIAEKKLHLQKIQIRNQKRKLEYKLMLTNIIYLAVFIILAFVLSIAVKAITRGVEAKQIIKEEKETNINNDDDKQNLEVVSQLKELKQLYDNEIINEQEFKKAKEKILK